MRPASVFVGGLNDDINKEDLEREFSKFGALSNVWVARNPPGFAFVEFDDEEDANEAIREMNGASINGSEIRVDMSRNNGRGRGRGGRGRRRGGFRGGRDGGFRSGRGGGYGGRGGYDSGSGYSRSFSSYGGGGRGGSSRYGGDNDYSRSSYSGSGGGGDYRSSGYRSRSPVGHRNGANW